MKVYCETPPDLSKAMGRVVAALKREAPRKTIQFVDTVDEADLVVLHVIGYPETIKAVAACKTLGKEYVIIQYCIRSTQRPNTRDWTNVWSNARLVWSYYELGDLVLEDMQAGDPLFKFNFYCSPLGVDPIFTRFEPYEVKYFTLVTTGYVAESESVSEAAAAVERVGGRHFHLGPKSVAPKAHMFGLNISDFALADVYNRSCWVSGLRRAEGFEMPAAEGLCAGARPILFDAPHYRRWYDGLADFIPEGSPDEVRESIVQLFERGYRPVSDGERAEACERFDWKRIIPGFWEGVLS